MSLSTLQLLSLWIRNIVASDASFDFEMRRELISKLFFRLAIVVIFMMVVGAVTRLTDSGLSIPEWPLINGTLMYPFTDADWNAVFETYKNYPQYHLINKGMLLSEFKFIFFFEYFHRSITSLVSLFLLLIMAIVVLKKESRALYFKPLLLLLGLLFLQAFVGAYMVFSGLKAEMAAVAQHMLMFHLGTAMVFLSLILWWRWRAMYSAHKLTKVTSPYTKMAKWVLGLAFLQFLSGALVAGTKAGHHFTDWPLMNGAFIPVGVWASHKGFLGNLFENIATIQFTHRMLAYTLTIVVVYFIQKLMHVSLTDLQRKSVRFLYVTLGVQILLGISTLMMSVPVVLGALHQLGGILLLINLLYVNFQLQYGSKS